MDERIRRVEASVGEKHLRLVAKLIPLPTLKKEDEGEEDDGGRDSSSEVVFIPNSRAAVQNSLPD